MTKENPFDLAIFALKRERGKAVIDDPCPICSYDAAIRVLEAAGKVDKVRAIKYSDDFLCTSNCIILGCQGPKIRDLLSALPDKAKP